MFPQSVVAETQLDEQNVWQNLLVKLSSSLLEMRKESYKWEQSGDNCSSITNKSRQHSSMSRENCVDLYTIVSLSELIHCNGRV